MAIKAGDEVTFKFGDEREDPLKHHDGETVVVLDVLNPEGLQEGPPTYQVRFPDGSKEMVYGEEVEALPDPEDLARYQAVLVELAKDENIKNWVARLDALQKESEENGTWNTTQALSIDTCLGFLKMARERAEKYV